MNFRVCCEFETWEDADRFATALADWLSMTVQVPGDEIRAARLDGITTSQRRWHPDAYDQALIPRHWLFNDASPSIEPVDT